MRLNPIGHEPEKVDIFSCYDPSINGLETLYEAWMYNFHPKEPNYYLCTPEDYRTIMIELHNRMFRNDQLADGTITYKGIKFVRSRDLTQGLIQLV